MRQYLKILSIILGSVIISCKSGSDKEILKISEDFLSSYFMLEYQRASDFCSNDLVKELLESSKNYDSLDPKVQESIKLHSSEIKYQILDFTINKTKDSAIVNYSVHLPNFSNEIESRLYFTKLDNEWKIYSFQK